MSSSFNRRIVFGLFVLCVLHSFPTEAHFKLFSKQSTSNTLRRSHLTSPSTSQALESHRQRPLHSSSSSSSAASTSDVYRSASSPTLNTANSPSLMQEISLHREAASTLNLGRVNIVRQNQQRTLLQRLKPNLERINSIGKYIKNGAIAAAGTGGIISIANAFSNNSEKKENSSDELIVYAAPITSTTTEIPERHNPLGEDK